MSIAIVPVLPANIGGFGNLQTTMEVYYQIEVTPMQRVFLSINEQIGGNAVAFRDPDWAG